jgi:selenocysteine lyase/cysteine desulfurase
MTPFQPSGVDVDLARAHTPGCANVLHFNNAGASLPCDPVLRAVTKHLELESQIGGYEAEAQAQNAVEHTYDALARLLACSRDEVALVENATRAWDMAVYSLRFTPGDRILIGRSEYASNVIAFLQIAQRTGVRVDVVPDDAWGQIDLAALERMIDDRVRLIALTHIPTNNGLVNPAAAVGAIARRAAVPFLLDACQSAGQLPLDVDALGCDMLSGTGRKFLRGPRGTGFLFVRRQWIERLEPPFLDLQAAQWTGPSSFAVRNDARRFETWESFVAGRIGLGVAVDYALSWGLENIAHRVSTLGAQLRDRLRDLNGVTVHDAGRVQCGIVTFSRAGEDATAILQRLRAARINVSVTQPSHARLTAGTSGAEPLVRASVHYYNTDKEVDRFCAVLAGA